MKSMGRTKRKVVVIGGSAGSIDPLTTILSALPTDFNTPVIVVLHISPTSKSMLSEVLSATTKLKVKEAESTEPIEPGMVYVAPPNYHLSVEPNFTLALSNEEPKSYSRPSIDILFESAADVYRSNIIGILLSGANADGSQGLKKIHDHKGVTIVQDPSSAGFEEMPQSALSLFKPDYKMSPGQISAVLGRSFSG